MISLATNLAEVPLHRPASLKKSISSHVPVPGSPAVPPGSPKSSHGFRSVPRATGPNALQEIKELLHLVGNELPLNVKIEL